MLVRMLDFTSEVVQAHAIVMIPQDLLTWMDVHDFAYTLSCDSLAVLTACSVASFFESSIYCVTDLAHSKKAALTP